MAHRLDHYGWYPSYRRWRSCGAGRCSRCGADPEAGAAHVAAMVGSSNEWAPVEVIDEHRQAQPSAIRAGGRRPAGIWGCVFDVRGPAGRALSVTTSAQHEARPHPAERCQQARLSEYAGVARNNIWACLPIGHILMEPAVRLRATRSSGRVVRRRRAQPELPRVVPDAGRCGVSKSANQGGRYVAVYLDDQDQPGVASNSAPFAGFGEVVRLGHPGWAWPRRPFGPYGQLTSPSGDSPVGHRQRARWPARAGRSTGTGKTRGTRTRA